MAAEDIDELRHRLALREAFGNSSDSDSDASSCAHPPQRWRWEAVERVRGLWLCAAFLSADEQSRLLAAIQRELAADDEDACPLPSDLLWREPLFDQLIANRYKPGEGICAHVDLMRFDDGIAIVSLESACVMHFSQAETGGGSTCGTPEQGEDRTRKVPVYLSPGSLVVMSGQARYLWKHEINRKQGCQVWDGRELEQSGRTSVTLRKLRASPN